VIEVEHLRKTYGTTVALAELIARAGQPTQLIVMLLTAVVAVAAVLLAARFAFGVALLTLLAWASGAAVLATRLFRWE
jgi:hypothetical protein